MQAIIGNVGRALLSISRATALTFSRRFTRRGAVIVRPTPGVHGHKQLWRDVQDAARARGRLGVDAHADPSELPTAALLRRARVRELWVLRAHTIHWTGWCHLGNVAAAARVRLVLIIHAAQPEPMPAWAARPLWWTVPRVIRLSNDALSLALGITPAEGWELDRRSRSRGCRHCQFSDRSPAIL